MWPFLEEPERTERLERLRALALAGHTSALKIFAAIESASGYRESALNIWRQLHRRDRIFDGADGHLDSTLDSTGWSSSFLTYEELDQLARDESSWTRAGVARNPYTSYETLRRLASDTEAQVRIALTDNPATPLELLLPVFEEWKVPTAFTIRESQEVRTKIGDHPFAPAEILSELKEDISEFVRSAVAGNANTDEATQVFLLDDPQDRIRISLARNAAIAPQVHEALRKIKKVSVVEALASNLSLTQGEITKFSENKRVEVKSEVAHNITTSEEILRRLADDPDDLYMNQLMGNPATPEDVRRNLFKRASSQMLEEQVWNLYAPLEVLETLAGHEDEYTAMTAQKTIDRLERFARWPIEDWRMANEEGDAVAIRNLGVLDKAADDFGSARELSEKSSTLENSGAEENL